MDMFDHVANQVAGANIRTINNAPSFNPRQNSNRSDSRSPKPLDIMSNEALGSLDDTLQKKFNSAKDSRSRNDIQKQIYSVQDEMSKRSSALSAEGDAKPVAVVSLQEQSKISGIGVNVGTGALIFGVLGFLVGATTTKPKLAILWGIGGATLGGLSAFFMSQDESGIKVI